MAFILIAVGIVVAYLDYLGTANVKAAGTLLKQEVFTNSDPFIKWLGALIIIALIGYIPELKPISTAFLILVILAIVLHHNSAFQAVVEAL